MSFPQEVMDPLTGEKIFQESNPEVYKEGDNRLESDLKNGLFDIDIEHMLEPYKEFLGVYALDEIDDIIEDVKEKDLQKFGFIIANSNRNTPGTTHWLAVYVDPIHNMEIDLFDPQGWPVKIPNKLKHDLKKMCEELGYDHFLKLKFNEGNVFQDPRENTCGLHSIIFLLKRFNGFTWTQSVIPETINMNEAECKKLFNNYQKYGYI